MKKLLFIYSLIFSTLLRAEVSCPKVDPTYFCITPEMAPNADIQQSDFYLIPVKIISLFQKELSALKYPLALDARWDSPYFGAGVSLYNNQFSLMILGGSTRIQGFTKEAYAALVCHELGHMIGGAPFQTIPGAEWSSSEGQSDFFAASVCLPRYFKSLGITHERIKEEIEAAGFEMMWAFKDIDSNNADKTIIRHHVYKKTVSQTLINTYPDLQCRYETFRAPEKRASCWFK